MSPPRLAAVVLLIISIVATGMLVFQHFVGAAIPGCAPGGACAQAAASAWGRVPGVNIPVSFIGLAYYLAIFAAFIRFRGELGAARWIVRLGVLASMLFVGVMIGGSGGLVLAVLAASLGLLLCGRSFRVSAICSGDTVVVRNLLWTWTVPRLEIERVERVRPWRFFWQHHDIGSEWAVALVRANKRLVCEATMTADERRVDDFVSCVRTTI